MRIGSFIIHLERAAGRRAQVGYLLETLPFDARVVAATDGADMSHAEQAAYQPRMLRPHYPFHLLSGEIAAFHSHRRCWQGIIDCGLDAGLIVEDDVQLHATQFSRAITLATAQLAQGDFVRLPIKPREKPLVVVSEDGDMRLFVPKVIGLGMVAQIVTVTAARRLLAQTERFDRPVDTFVQLQWAHGVRVLTLWPSGVSEVSSRLGGSQIGRRKSVPEKLHREIMRPVYRLGLAARAAMARRR